MSTVTGAPARSRSRSAGLDRIRGLAIASMIVDHVFLVIDGPHWVRETVGRLALPLFFIVSGHLVRRLSWRHYAIVCAGLVLPALVPWIDSPNVLVYYVLGAAMLVGARAVRVPPLLLVAVCLTFAANSWAFGLPHSYDGVQLLGLMALGAALPRASFAWGDRLPNGLCRMGARPLTWYLCHLLILEFVTVAIAHGGNQLAVLVLASLLVACLWVQTAPRSHSLGSTTSAHDKGGPLTPASVLDHEDAPPCSTPL